jgi:hypothetical protein
MQIKPALCVCCVCIYMYIYIYIYIYFFWYWGLNSVLMLARQTLYHLSHTPSPFALVIFEIGFCFMNGLVWNAIFLFLLSK